MRKITIPLITSFLLLLIFLWIQPIIADCKELKSINVELESCRVIFSGKDNICLLQVYKIFNPNDRLVSATLNYTIRLEEEILGSAQLPLIYIPSKKTIEQRDSVVVEYKAWFAKLYFQGKSPGEALKIVLPLWKGFGGEEPSRLPEGMWSKVTATKPEIQTDGSITLTTEDGKEGIFFFKTSAKVSE